jgi:hypothetical protein
MICSEIISNVSRWPTNQRASDIRDSDIVSLQSIQIGPMTEMKHSTPSARHLAKRAKIVVQARGDRMRSTLEDRELSPCSRCVLISNSKAMGHGAFSVACGAAREGAVAAPEG